MARYRMDLFADSTTLTDTETGDTLTIPYTKIRQVSKAFANLIDTMDNAAIPSVVEPRDRRIQIPRNSPLSRNGPQPL